MDPVRTTIPAGLVGLLMASMSPGSVAASDWLDWRTAKDLPNAWGQIGVEFARGSGPYVEMRQALVYPIPGDETQSPRERLQQVTVCMIDHVLAPRNAVSIYLSGCTPADDHASPP
jgi:hypothetical protein